MVFHVVSILVSAMISGMGFFLAFTLIRILYHRKQDFVWWGISQLLYVTGMVLLAARDSIPDFYSIIVGNFLILVGYGCIWIGSSIYKGRKIRIRTIILLIVSYLMVHLYFTYIRPDITFRVVNTDLSIALMSTGISVTILSGWRKRKSIIECMPAFPLIADVIFKIVIVSVQLVNDNPAEPFQRNPYVAYVSLAGLLVQILWGISVFLMVFDGLFANARSAEDEAVNSKNLLRTILDTIPTRVFWKNSDLSYIGANARFLRDVKISDIAELQGKKDSDLVWKENALLYQIEEQNVMRTGKAELYHEGSMPAGENGMMDILMSRIPLVNSTHRIIGVVGAYQDITEQKKAREKINLLLNEKEMLLKEVHHRIKNNMSIISSILHLQAGKSADSTVSHVLLEARNRVLSMMLIYDRLYRSSDYRKLSVADYLNMLIDEISAIYPKQDQVSVTKKIDSFELDSEKLFPVGILINELLTNSYKYAFTEPLPGDRKPEIGVVVTKGPDDMVTMEIDDNGNGFPEVETEESKKGFGLILVGLLSDQLEAKITRNISSGVHYRIVFPGV
ncbi:MAG TPA: histidine kinase dimerization/phosphoacceptor domain -containing protein [Spirochaetota bacterium]